MANVPIVTEVTKAELDALVAANGLNEGLQYKVTDTAWILIAISNNILTPVKNIVLIDESESLPTYLDIQTLIIKKDIIMSFPEGQTIIPIVVPLGFEILSLRVVNRGATWPPCEVWDSVEENMIFNCGINVLTDQRFDICQDSAPLSKQIKYSNLSILVQADSTYYIADSTFYFKFNKIEYSI